MIKKSCILSIILNTFMVLAEPPINIVKETPVGVEDSAASKNSIVAEKQYGEEYSPVGKRDPFQSFLDDAAKNEGGLHPLQRYELSQLKLIGIVANISVPRAMFEDPTGKGWIVKHGALIGRHSGRIKKINTDSVIILEEYQDRAGKLVLSEITIKLENSSGSGVAEPWALPIPQ